MGFQLKRILVPIDFSSQSNHALELANLLGEQFGAELELVHVVVESPVEVYQQSRSLQGTAALTHIGTIVPRSEPQFIVRDIIEETRTKLNILLKEKSQHRIEVRHGHVVSELLAEIKRFKPDLVVICTHGWTGLKHMMLGSVAEKLVRLSPAPVLCTHGPAE